MEVLRSYESCKRGSSTLEYYFRLFKFRLNAAIAARFSCGDEQEQANRFFEGLDNARFGVFKSNVLHGLHPIPHSVQEVYSAALNFEEIKKRGSQYTDYASPTTEEIALPLFGEQSQKKKGKKQRPHSPGTTKAHARAIVTTASGGPATSPAASTRGTQPQPVPSATPDFNLAPCRHCGGSHRHRECPTNNARKAEARAQRENAQAVSRQLAAPAVIAEDESYLSSDIQEVTLSVGNTIYPDEWGLDSMAAKSFLRDKKFGYNFREADKRVRFNGVGGPVVCDIQSAMLVLLKGYT